MLLHLHVAFSVQYFTKTVLSSKDFKRSICRDMCFVTMIELCFRPGEIILRIFYFIFYYSKLVGQMIGTNRRTSCADIHYITQGAVYIGRNNSWPVKKLQELAKGPTLFTCGGKGRKQERGDGILAILSYK